MDETMAPTGRRQSGARLRQHRPRSRRTTAQVDVLPLGRRVPRMVCGSRSRVDDCRPREATSRPGGGVPAGGTRGAWARSEASATARGARRARSWRPPRAPVGLRRCDRRRRARTRRRTSDLGLGHHVAPRPASMSWWPPRSIYSAATRRIASRRAGTAGTCSSTPPRTGAGGGARWRIAERR